MKMRFQWIGAVALLVVAAVVFLARQDDRDMAKMASASSASPSTPIPVTSPSPVAKEPESKMFVDQFVEEGGFPQMGDLEFSRFQVDLPKPVNAPWKGPLFNSESVFREDVKLTAVDVLSTWIRKAVHEGKQDIAARFLWSLMRLAEDANPEVATNAVFQIYRLGDIDRFAISKMREWIEKDVSYKGYVTKNGATVYADVRARVLDDLAFFRDRSLDDVIYSKWRENQATEGKNLAAVDYAYYLEKHGRELPVGYWMQRLDNPYGFEHALEIAEQKAAPEVTTKLQSIFEQLRSRPATTPEAGRAASVAASLYRQTGDARYRDYLIEQARVPLASGSFESSLPEVLEGLAATNDKAALEVVSTAMRHENTVIQEMAIDALGKSRDPAAAELLFEAAIQKAKQGKGFPARELRALLAQGDPSADSKYERLQQALLSGQLGWSATRSDFESLEFFRKHGRQ